MRSILEKGLIPLDRLLIETEKSKKKWEFYNQMVEKGNKFVPEDYNQMVDKENKCDQEVIGLSSGNSRNPDNKKGNQ